jgi:glycerophosphoryl diester phosphodiesterase
VKSFVGRISDILFNPLFRSSWRSVVLLWKPMAGWTILVYALFTAIFAPLLITLLDWGIFRGDRVIVGNEELYTWFFSPAGFTYLFIVLLITLTGLVVRYAGLFQIVTDHLLGREVSVKETALHIAPRIHILIKLCAVTIAGALLLLLPMAIGLGAVYLIWLTEFDINYYILTTPPEWYRAITWAAIWSGVWAVTALITAACALPALPAYLDGKKTILQAIREVWEAPMKKTLKLIKTVAVASIIWISLRLLSDAVLLFSFYYLTDWLHTSMDSLRMAAFIIGTYLFLSLSLGTVISFFGFSMISVIVTKFYYSNTRPTLEQEIPGLMRLTRKTITLLTWWAKPLRLASLILVVLAGGVAMSYFITGRAVEERQVLNIAHRANALGAPENSIAALENSISVGADMAEIDVQMTADGTVVLLHDADLMRVAGDPRRIADITYDEISELHLLTDQELPPDKIGIPTLAEYLEASRDRIKLLIELKYYGYYPELAEETIRIVREHGMTDQVLIMSLSMPAVQQVMEIAPDFAVGYTSAVAAGDLVRLPVDFLAIFHQNVTPQLVAAYAERGRPLFAWTVNDAADMVRAIENGAGGLITDEPVLAGSIIREMSKLTRAERLLLRFGFIVLEGGSALAGTDDNNEDF